MDIAIAKDRLASVVKPDSITASQGDFLATHVAIKKLVMLNKSLRKESKVVQTKKQYGDFSLTALSFASISIFSG